ncbi:hypothetical protein AAMO2058_001087900 [Amorphochlora amoebiformis]
MLATRVGPESPLLDGLPRAQRATFTVLNQREKISSRLTDCFHDCWVFWKEVNPYVKCLASMIAYFAIGTLAYMLAEGWDLLDTVYFLVITLTTVGYGDVAPKTNAGKIVTIFMIYLGILLVGSLIADVFETIFDAHEGVFLDDVHQLGEDEMGPDVRRMHDLRTLIVKKGETEVKRGIFSVCILFLCIYIVGVVWTMVVGGLNLIDALYFTTVTISTVGYGDYSGSNLRDNQVTKIWDIFFVVISVFSLGAMITTIINVWAGVIRRRKIIGMVDEKITNADFNRFLSLGDVNGDERIDMAEFAFICLDELGLLSSRADAATMLAIQAEFKRADKSKSGFIDRSDVVQEVTVRRLRYSLSQESLSIRRTQTDLKL